MLTRNRLSFGGNRLQVKAEDKILAVIEDLLQKIPCPDATTTRKSLRTKQSLLLALVESERFRLRVWLAPLFSDWKSTSQPSNNTRNTQDVRYLIPLTILNCLTDRLVFFFFSVWLQCCLWLGTSIPVSPYSLPIVSQLVKSEMICALCC